MGNCGGKGNAKILEQNTQTPSNLDQLLAKNIPIEYIQPNEEEDLARRLSMSNFGSMSDINLDNEGQRKNIDRRKKFFAAETNDEEMAENVQKIEGKTFARKDILFIINALKKNSIFFNLKDNELEYVVNKMMYCKAKKGENIFTQDDARSCTFFLIG